MRFDVVIIGGGLAGFTAGLRLLESGASCAMVSMGQSALHFSSGSFDFLNRLPDGRRVERPLEVLSELARQAPEHPYSLLGEKECAAMALEAEKLLNAWGLGMKGSLGEGNHSRLSPLGKLVPTWLSSRDVLTTPDYTEDSHPDWPWKNAALINVEGFLDCYPEILAANLDLLGLPVRSCSFTLRDLETLRANPSEFRSINIARVLDRPENFEPLVEELDKAAGQAEAIIIPACLGLKDPGRTGMLERRLGREIRLIPTLPPSLVGSRINRLLARLFIDKGGVLMPGDKATGFDLAPGPGPVRVRRLFTANHEETPLEAGHYILASGSFSSKGLLADQHDIWEPVFHLDLVAIPPGREQWTVNGVFEAQPYASFGVATDASMRGYLAGTPLGNLRVAGMVIGNYDAVRLGCGAGVALVTGLAAADAILKGRD